MTEVQKQLEVIRRGTINFIHEKDFVQKIENSLKRKKPLRVKLGVDPTSSDIHLGHTVVLQKLRQFQDLGHQAVLIIGDYTALVGDPSGTLKTRPQLSQGEIQKNAKTYFEQVQKILNQRMLEIRYNSEWFSSMTFTDVIRLASRMTVARMLERDDFSKRFKGGSPISIHEFIYPLMQGYDSLMVKADVEIGGTDQIFNLLVGRSIQKEEGEEEQAVLTTPLLEGTDGIQKMSKSLGNYIGISEPPSEIFGKVMSISDELMWKYYELLSSLSFEAIHEKRARAKTTPRVGKTDSLNPKDAKLDLAHELVERFYSKKEADLAQEEFDRIFHSRKNPAIIEEVSLSVQLPIKLFSLLSHPQACLTSSHAEAKRLIKQGAVSIDGKKETDISKAIASEGAYLFKVGKLKFKKIHLQKKK